jgi:hypothetical protein
MLKVVDPCIQTFRKIEPSLIWRQSRTLSIIIIKGHDNIYLWTAQAAILITMIFQVILIVYPKQAIQQLYIMYYSSTRTNMNVRVLFQVPAPTAEIYLMVILVIAPTYSTTYTPSLPIHIAY